MTPQWSGIVATWLRGRRAAERAVLLAALSSGCTSLPPRELAIVPVEKPPAEKSPKSAAVDDKKSNSGIVQVSFCEACTSDEMAVGKPLSTSPFAGAQELSVESLVDQVLARSPSLTEMAAAWEAATARYPQMTSLDDPMLGASLAPGSFGSHAVSVAYRVEASQKLPFPGKLRLRGDAANAEASAASHDLDDMRLQLIESAKDAFYEYYMIVRAIEVNADSVRLLKEFRDNAQNRYKTGLVSQQDVLQADVEIGSQQERQLSLERMRTVVIARINTLMHLPARSPLPPPPPKISTPSLLPAVDGLLVSAHERRPDLKALSDRISADQASLELAVREFKPDFEVMAAYDTWWQSPQEDLRSMIGMKMNAPIRKKRRYAAIAEARAKLAQRSAELTRLTDQLNFQVEQAYAQVVESEKAVRLYETAILASAQENIKSAQSAYVTGKIPFLSLIEAERSLIDLRDRYYEVLSDYYRRRALLERVIGGPFDEIRWENHDHSATGEKHKAVASGAARSQIETPSVPAGEIPLAKVVDKTK